MLKLYLISFLFLVLIVVITSSLVYFLIAITIGLYYIIYKDFTGNISVIDHFRRKIKNFYYTLFQHSVHNSTKNSSSAFKDSLWNMENHMRRSPSANVSNWAERSECFSPIYSSRMLPKYRTFAKATSTPLFNMQDTSHVDKNFKNNTSLDANYHQRSSFSPNNNLPDKIIPRSWNHTSLSPYADSRNYGLATRFDDNNEKSYYNSRLNTPPQLPIVRLFKKEVAMVPAKRRTVTVHIAQPDSANYDAEQKRLVLQNIMKETQSKLTENTGTRSVLDALKEISRKRIHSEALQEISNESNSPNKNDYAYVNKAKRTKEELCLPHKNDGVENSEKKTFDLTLPVVDPITASLTSSDKEFIKTILQKKRKAKNDSFEIEKAKKIIKLQDGQTQTANELIPIQPDNSEKIKELSSKEVSVEKLVKKRTSAKKVFDDKPLEINRKKRLALILNSLSGNISDPDFGNLDKSPSSLETLSVSPKKVDKHVTFNETVEVRKIVLDEDSSSLNNSDKNDDKNKHISTFISLCSSTTDSNPIYASQTTLNMNPVKTVSTGTEVQADSPQNEILSKLSSNNTEKQFHLGGFKFDLSTPSKALQSSTSPILPLSNPVSTKSNETPLQFCVTSMTNNSNTTLVEGSKPELGMFKFQSSSPHSGAISSANSTISPPGSQKTSYSECNNFNSNIDASLPVGKSSFDAKSSFLTAATTQNSSFNFGTPTTSFSTTTSKTSTSTESSKTPTSSFGFVTTTSSAKPTLSFGSGTTTSSAKPTLSFGSATSTSVSTFNFGNVITTTSSDSEQVSATKSIFGNPITTSTNPNQSFEKESSASSALNKSSVFGAPTSTFTSTNQPAIFGLSTKSDSKTTASSIFGTSASVNFGSDSGKIAPIVSSQTSSSFGSATQNAASFNSTTQSTPNFVGGNQVTSNSNSNALTKPVVVSKAPTTSIFGDSSSNFGAENQKTLNFGSPAKSIPSFGSSTGQTPSFASPIQSFGFSTQQAPSFGSTTQPTSNFVSTTQPTPSFGSTTHLIPSFGSTTQPTPTFGSTSQPTPSFGSTTQSPPNFGSANQTNSGFGPNTQSPSVFGSNSTRSNLNFGEKTHGTSVFEAATQKNTFGANPQSVFRGGTQSPSIFGDAQQSPFGTKTETFTSNPKTTASIFGSSNTTTTTANSIFGLNSTSFGSNSSQGGFGSSTNQTNCNPGTQSTFGSSNNQLGFGAGNQNAFGSITQSGLSTTTQANFASNTPSGFGTLQNNLSTSTTQSGFGVTSQQFGFGSNQLQPSFGLSNNQPATFGSPNNQQPSNFGSSGNQQPSNFGSSGQQQPSNFGSSGNQQPSNFGSSGNQQPSTFGSSGNQQPSTFGSSNNNQTSTFGSTPSQPFAFGSSNTATPGATSGVFSFGTSNNNTNKSTPNFTAGTNLVSPFNNAPNFNAPTPTGMFSIGSGGSSTPNKARSVRMRRRV